MSKRTLYFENTHEINMVNNTVESTAVKLNRFWESWKMATTQYVGKVKPVTREMMLAMFTNGTPDGNQVDDTLRTLLARERLPQYPDFSFEGLKQALKEPDISGVFSALDSFNSTDFNSLHFFVFTPDGITPDTETIETNHDQRFREYAETPAEHERLKMAQTIRDGMNVVLTANPHVSLADCVIPLVLFVYDGRLEISYHWVKWGRFNTARMPGDVTIKMNI